MQSSSAGLPQHCPPPSPTLHSSSNPFYLLHCNPEHLSGKEETHFIFKAGSSLRAITTREASCCSALDVALDAFKALCDCRQVGELVKLLDGYPHFTDYWVEALRGKLTSLSSQQVGGNNRSKCAPPHPTFQLCFSNKLLKDFQGHPSCWLTLLSLLWIILWAPGPLAASSHALYLSHNHACRATAFHQPFGALQVLSFVAVCRS